jgi:hypothetical protein
MPESRLIVDRLKTITELGMITYESQPSGHPDPAGPGVAVHQAAYLELSGPPDLMDQLDRMISRANRTSAEKIMVVRPDEARLMPLRVAVAADEQSLAGFRFNQRIEIERGQGHVFARLGHMVHNNSRYLNQLAQVPGLARILQGHVTLFLASSAYAQSDETLLFDQLIGLIQEARLALVRQALEDSARQDFAAKVKALEAEPRMPDSELLTTEETGTSHLDDLV